MPLPQGQHGQRLHPDDLAAIQATAVEAAKQALGAVNKVPAANPEPDYSLKAIVKHYAKKLRLLPGGKKDARS